MMLTKRQLKNAQVAHALTNAQIHIRGFSFIEEIRWHFLHSSTQLYFGNTEGCVDI